jgi:hypothetical protein
MCQVCDDGCDSGVAASRGTTHATKPVVEGLYKRSVALSGSDDWNQSTDGETLRRSRICGNACESSSTIRAKIQLVEQ